MRALFGAVVLAGFALVAGVAHAQDSRPSSAPATRPGPPKLGELFRPEAADPAAKNLVSLARAHLALDWFTRQKAPKPPARDNTMSQDEIDMLNMAIHLAGEVRRLEADAGVRASILQNGMPARNGARVLPLGRFEWQKPPSKKGQASEWSQVLGIAMAAATPASDVKGFHLKGEFLDANGKVVASVNERSLAVETKSGVFVVAVPAKAALGDLRLFEGFQFRLIDLKALK
jgi:hypothetical protein